MVLSTWSIRAALNSSASPTAPKRAAAPERMTSRKRLGARRAARLAGENDGEPELAQTPGEPARLHRLAGALPAFERDEPAPRRRAAHQFLANVLRIRPMAELDGGVEGPLAQAAERNGGRGLQRRVERQRLSAPDLEPRHLDARGDRRRQRTEIDDLRVQPVPF